MEASPDKVDKMDLEGKGLIPGGKL